jgi:Na+-translocating ferredoxin:NAD+ oxidoreductase subunit D
MKSALLPAVSFRPFRTGRLLYSHVNYSLMLLCLPALIWGGRIYGLYTVRTVAAAMAACIVLDVLFEKLFRKTTRIFDGSAALTGMLLGMLFPPLVPWWTIIVASFAAIFLGRQLFGGAGGSPFNAVCIGWAVVMISWPKLIDPTYGSVPFSLPFSVEFPLSELRRLGADALPRFPVFDLFMGKQAGCVGTGASMLLVAGGLIGIILGLIPWIIPVSFFCAMAITASCFAVSGHPVTALPLFHLVTGFSCIGAFFIAADHSSRPVSRRVMVLYGAMAGVLTVLFRTWSAFPEGLPFALLIVNIVTPLFDRGKAPANEPPVEVRRI